MKYLGRMVLLSSLAVLLSGRFYAGELQAGWKVAFQSKYSDDKKMYAAGFLNDQFGVMAGYGGAVFYTSDGGKSWYKGQNSSWCRWGIDILDEKTAFTCGNKGHNRITKDGGITWDNLSDFGDMEPDNGKFISFADKTHGWIATRLKLAATKDGGTSWTELNLPAECKTIYAIDQVKENTGYVLDRTGQVFLTKDNGQNWSKIQLDLKDRTIIPYAFNNTVAAVNFTDENNGRAVLFVVKPERQWITFKTSDGGKSWKEETLPMNTFGTVYLSHDGNTLSITDTIDKMITVLHPL